MIGGGGTGAALAHDLTLRGLDVSLLERGELFSGATGRHHGLLHSGARYAVHDPEAAKECFRENQILRSIAPYAIEANDGLFVAVDQDDLTYLDAFLEGCAAAGIPTQNLTRDQALALEPALSPRTRLAVRVPDATIDAYRLPLSFLASAIARGAVVRRFTEVVDFVRRDGAICGVRCRDRRDGHEGVLEGDIVVNTAGAWAGHVATLAGATLPIRPGPGVMVALSGRLTRLALNRLQPAGEGDIIVPQRRLTVVGTSLWLADEPDQLRLPEGHVQRMIALGALLVPAVAEAPIRAAWCAPRPLIDDGEPSTTGPVSGPQQISRTFRCYDHGSRDGQPGLLSVIGGKATTLRAMAESAADEVCELLGKPEACRTHDVVLPHYRAFFHLRDQGTRGV